MLVGWREGGRVGAGYAAADQVPGRWIRIVTGLICVYND